MPEMSREGTRSFEHDLLNYGYLAFGLGRSPVRVEWTGLFRALTSNAKSPKVDHISAQQRITWVGDCGCWSLSLDLGVMQLYTLTNQNHLANTTTTYDWRGGLRVQLGLPAPQSFVPAFKPLEF